MTSCAYPGCPSTGTYEQKGKLYCGVHLPTDSWKGPYCTLPVIARVNVKGREN